MSSSLPQTDGRKLLLFRERDPLKYWWSLDEMRFCAKCEHLFLGREIRLTADDHGELFFHCPTRGCAGSWEDWQYPELHL
jgi:hypothetical protein